MKIARLRSALNGFFSAQNNADQGQASAETVPSANDASTIDTPATSVNADAPNPGVAPLVSIIEDDETGNPHAQMYTTLLDADGKVVDTNDPNHAVDKKYQPTSQGGEGAGLNKGADVTVHFRMAAITPQNADGDVEKRVDILGDFQYVTTVGDHVAGGSTVVLTYVPGGTVSFKVNEDIPLSAGEEYRASIDAASGEQTSYYVHTQLCRTTQEDAAENSSDAAFAYKSVEVSLDNNMG